jgi:hypothetical protein
VKDRATAEKVSLSGRGKMSGKSLPKQEDRSGIPVFRRNARPARLSTISHDLTRKRLHRELVIRVPGRLPSRRHYLDELHLARALIETQL